MNKSKLLASLSLPILLSGCSFLNSATLLSDIGNRRTFSLYEYTQVQPLFYNVASFGSNFTNKYVEAFEEDNKNLLCSPISLYCALGMLSECASNETRSELLTYLDMSIADIRKYSSYLFNTLDVEENHAIGSLANSIWIQEGFEYKQECLTNLSTYHYAASYSTDFLNKNKQSNDSIKAYVKKKTHGLINKDFEMDQNTLIALINTLYIKDIWEENDKLEYTSETYNFKNGDNSTTETKLLEGLYFDGQAVDCGTYLTFKTHTHSKYTVHFILPKTGYTAYNIMKNENLNSVIRSSLDYQTYTEETYKHHTRCIFPEFDVEDDQNITDILTNSGLTHLKDANGYQNISDKSLFVKKIRQCNKLTVNRKGIEGAAVTAIQMCGEAGPEPYIDVYHDFVMDRDFGFIVTNNTYAPLFSGVINKL